jgi:hypothetical protein
VSALDQQIDELYTLPLTQFTAARNALAKSLKGDDAARVKGLEKPSVVAWSVNQLYWVERRTFERLMAAGKALRTAQIAALKGRSSDLRGATADHRSALADAVAAATRIAGGSGAHPAAEPLSRMLEALSVSPELPAPPGRFTDIVQPAGFEALAGITPAARPQPVETTPAVRPSGKATSSRSTGRDDAAAEREREKAAAAERKAAEAAVADAQRTLSQATAAEERASGQVERARQQLSRTEADLAAASDAVREARRELSQAETALEKLTGPHRTRRS